MKKIIALSILVLTFSECSEKEFCGYVNAKGTNGFNERWVEISNTRIKLRKREHTDVMVGDHICIPY